MKELDQEAAKRKQAEQALRASEELLKMSQAIAHIGSWELDLLKNRLTWSDEVYRMFGLRPLEFDATYEAFLDMVHPDDRAAVDTAYSNSLRHKSNTYEIEHRIIRRDSGEVRVVHEKCQHMRNATNRIIRSVGMVQDITDRKRIEKELREGEKRFRTLVENAADSFFLCNQDGIIVDVNDRACKSLGYT